MSGCGGKKKVKKFAEGGLPAFTSVSSLNEDGSLKEVDTAARLAEFKKWQAEHNSAPKPAPKPVKKAAPKMEEVVVSASRLTPKNDKAPLARGSSPSKSTMLAMARALDRKPSRYQREIDAANRSFGRSSGPSMTPYAKGGKVRGDGCCSKGKTKGKMR